MSRRTWKAPPRTDAHGVSGQTLKDRQVVAEVRAYYCYSLNSFRMSMLFV